MRVRSVENTIFRRASKSLTVSCVEKICGSSKIKW